jgi:2-C-methyl-D-erythritol 4-phosphate cytidylyltransferase
MNTAIIVAAGSGTRFGGDVPKQFVEILGKPLLIHTLQRFENCLSVDEIILVLAAEYIESHLSRTKLRKISKLNKCLVGGATRAESVFNGLSSVVGNPDDIVVVHDGARPLVTSDEISKTIESAKKNGAACLVGSVNDTIKRVSEGKIAETIDRENLRRALTPQCFQLEILKRAFENADLSKKATDECFLVEKLGQKIAFVDGSARNIKITTEDDLKIAEMFLQEENV